RDALVHAMGHADQKQIERQAEQQAQQESESADVQSQQLLEVKLPAASPVGALGVRRGQVVGLSGLAGQGQTEMLIRLFEQYRGKMRVA
ncbi:hypothetical protein, partial [Salmonella enterica]